VIRKTFENILNKATSNLTKM